MTTTASERCSFRAQEWADGAEFGIDGPVLVCDLHGYPAEGAAYDTGVGLCQPTREYVEQHTTQAADDPSRCRCGRAWETCIGAADARAIVEALAQDATSSVCRHCGRAVTRDDDRWVDATRDPAFCPHAISFRHAPENGADR